MENWRQDRYSEVCKALKRIERRGDKLARRIDSSSISLSVGQQQQQQQQQQKRNSSNNNNNNNNNNNSNYNNKQEDAKQVALWSDELARLRDMNDRLVDFRDGLYFYSNMDYVEALNEWEHEVEKICVKAEGFSTSQTGPKKTRASSNHRRHGSYLY